MDNENVVYGRMQMSPGDPGFAEFCKYIWPALMAEMFAKTRTRVLLPIAVVLCTAAAVLMAFAENWVFFGLIVGILGIEAVLFAVIGPLQYLAFKRLAKRRAVVEFWCAPEWFALRGEGFRQVNDRRIAYSSVEYLREYVAVTVIRIVGFRVPILLVRQQAPSDAYRLIFNGTAPAHRPPSRARQRALQTQRVMTPRN